MLGMPEGAVRSRLARGREQLRQIYEEREYEKMCIRDSKNTHAAYPVGKAAPENKTLGYDFHIGKDG